MAGVAPAACHMGAPGCRPVSFDLVLKHGPESGSAANRSTALSVVGEKGHVMLKRGLGCALDFHSVA